MACKINKNNIFYYSIRAVIAVLGMQINHATKIDSHFVDFAKN